MFFNQLRTKMSLGIAVFFAVTSIACCAGDTARRLVAKVSAKGTSVAESRESLNSKQLPKLSEVKLYEKPEDHARVVATLKDGEQVLIFTQSGLSNWSKVVNAKDGSSGWVRSQELRGPVVVTNINGVLLRQQIINLGQVTPNTQNYQVVQYSSSESLPNSDSEKLKKELAARSKKLHELIHEEHARLERQMAAWDREFAKIFTGVGS